MAHAPLSIWHSTSTTNRTVLTASHSAVPSLFLADTFFAKR